MYWIELFIMSTLIGAFWSLMLFENSTRRKQIVAGVLISATVAGVMHGSDLGFFETSAGIAIDTIVATFFYGALLMGVLHVVAFFIKETDNPFKKIIPAAIRDSFDIEEATKKRKTVVFLFCCLLSFGYLTMKQYWGTDTIGSVFARDDFKTTCYVNIFEDKSYAKNFRLKAEIEVVNGIPYPYRAYFPNGGYLYFEDAYDLYEPLKYGQKIHYTDQYNRDWYMELTKEKAD